MYCLQSLKFCKICVYERMTGWSQEIGLCVPWDNGPCNIVFRYFSLFGLNTVQKASIESSSQYIVRNTFRNTKYNVHQCMILTCSRFNMQNVHSTCCSNYSFNVPDKVMRSLKEWHQLMIWKE